MNESIHAVLCPHCGMVFLPTPERFYSLCPSCERRCKPRPEILLQAELQADDDEL